MKRTFVVTADDVFLLVALVATLDPKDFVHDGAKAMIYRCKSTLSDPPTHVRVVPE